LDEITGGGLPQGRPTLVCAGTGCGKTLLAMEFLVRGATEQDEPGVYMSFEEKSEELTKNFASLGFDLIDLVAGKRLALDCRAPHRIRGGKGRTGADNCQGKTAQRDPRRIDPGIGTGTKSG